MAPQWGTSGIVAVLFARAAFPGAGPVEPLASLMGAPAAGDEPAHVGTKVPTAECALSKRLHGESFESRKEQDDATQGL